MRWIDITQPLENGMAVWPGDTEFSFRLAWTKEQSGSVNVGSLQMSTHTGTHVDAPFHFDQEGKKIVDFDPELFVGTARLIHLPERAIITVEDVKCHDLTGVSRLLIRTGAWMDRKLFPQQIPPLAPELAPYLQEQGIRLIGVDLPSVDLLDSKDLPAHHALHRHGIAILEGLVLDSVAEGDYELIALPLKIVDGDASPVRAVLRVKEG